MAQGRHGRAWAPVGIVTWGVQRTVLGLVVLALLVWVGTAAAHRLDLSLRTVGDRLEGRATFHGGQPVVGAVVEVSTASGGTVARGVTDGEGRFSLTVPEGEPLQVLVVARDGHAARASLATGALPPLSTPSPAAREASEALAQRLAELVREEVARQMNPLAEELAALRRQVALRDILGGFGYILGLTGLTAYLLTRRGGRGGEGDR